MLLTQIIERYRHEYEKQYGHCITPQQRHAMQAMLACRGGRYGKMQLDCQQCGFAAELNHSCGHRFCHRCQHHDTKQWLQRQSQKLLPCDYFLVTFTLPRQLRAMAYHHQSTIYSLMFDCVASTMKDFFAHDKHLKSQAGMTAVLHTHSRRLNFHPHIHVVIPAGGLNTKSQCWISHRKGYLFSQRNLAKVFRARLLHGMKQLGLSIPSGMPKKWIVDCRQAGHGLPALKYLSRYLYRGVINENNIIADDGTHVTFKYRCSQTAKYKHRTLAGAQFLKLLFRHVLPKGLRRVRDYGFLHGNAKRKLQRIQLVLNVILKPNIPVVRAAYLCKKCQHPMDITAFIRPDPLTG